MKGRGEGIYDSQAAPSGCPLQIGCFSNTRRRSDCMSAFMSNQSWYIVSVLRRIIVVREASVNILATFVGRRISFRKYVVQCKLWDCRMEHVVLEAKNGPFRYDFDYKLVHC